MKLAYKPDWAERKARVVKHDKRLMQRATKLYMSSAVFSCSDLVYAMQQEQLRERRRAVRKCRELERKSINGYALGCSDCATAIAGGK